METREERGIVIAAKSNITRKGKRTFAVPSQSGRGEYTVEYDRQDQHCDCPDFETHQSKCKHIFAVECVIQRETKTEGNVTTTTETRTVRVTYGQDWSAYHAAQVKEKALFQALLYDLCQGIIEPPRTKGRKPIPLADMVFAGVFKTYSTVSCRRFMTDLTEAQEKGYISRLPHYNSIFNYLEMASVTPLLKALITQSAMPLKAIERDFAVDSSGFSTCQYDRWFDEKYGKMKSKHDWIKMHVMTGVTTNVITSVEITDRDGADCPRYPGLVMDTARNFNIEQVSADKAYSSLENHEWTRAAHATPFIAFKENASGKVGGLYRKMFHYYRMNREEFMTNYHKRSNVESTFSMVKAKFGGRLRSKTATAQTNEALCKVLAHNICCVIQSTFEFGVDPSFYERAN